VGKPQTKWECIMNEKLEKALNQIVNLLSQMNERLTNIENAVKKDKKKLLKD
jgi:hypothetical protein|tara:strand:- start:1130 stop:1285 length:156 start_codon:yes stop_codon:yes gene_type:complete